ncbi:hypothetical protein OH77DRAFT_735702 [Trametes cingulata]|nr:hypothetical protein OH77DRAFT_735702 [Trametes cingulata]
MDGVTPIYSCWTCVLICWVDGYHSIPLALLLFLFCVFVGVCAELARLLECGFLRHMRVSSSSSPSSSSSSLPFAVLRLRLLSVVTFSRPSSPLALHPSALHRSPSLSPRLAWPSHPSRPSPHDPSHVLSVRPHAPRSRSPWSDVFPRTPPAFISAFNGSHAPAPALVLRVLAICAFARASHPSHPFLFHLVRSVPRLVSSRYIVRLYPRISRFARSEFSRSRILILSLPVSQSRTPTLTLAGHSYTLYLCARIPLTTTSSSTYISSISF